MFSRLQKYFYRFSTSYHPLKKLDFSSSPFQPIYQNSLEVEIPKIVEKSFFFNLAPFTLYSLSYLMFLTSSFTSIGIGGVLAIGGLVNFCRKFEEMGRFVHKMEIDANGENLKIFYGFWDKKLEEKARKMKVNIVDRQRGIVCLPISEIKSIKFLIEEKNRLEVELEEDLKKSKNEKEEETNKIKKQQKQENDILEIVIEREDQNFEIFLFIEHNALPCYNDYLTALGRGQKLVLN